MAIVPVTNTRSAYNVASTILRTFYAFTHLTSPLPKVSPSFRFFGEETKAQTSLSFPQGQLSREPDFLKRCLAMLCRRLKLQKWCHVNASFKTCFVIHISEIYSGLHA